MVLLVILSVTLTLIQRKNFIQKNRKFLSKRRKKLLCVPFENSSTFYSNMLEINGKAKRVSAL